MAQIVATAGIDVSKDRLDVAVHPTDEQFSVSNDEAGWRELVRRLKPSALAAWLQAAKALRRGRRTTFFSAPAKRVAAMAASAIAAKCPEGAKGLL